jgi:small GTP-binding protein
MPSETLTKKVCMLGSPGVGKTSLVERFVHSRFSEKYHATLGVKIDRKTVSVGGRSVQLMLWDLAGDDGVFHIPASYLHGASGYLLVVDGTRRITLEDGSGILARLRGEVGLIPGLALWNKHDLAEDWTLSSEDELVFSGSEVDRIYRTSAKTGEHVEEAFQTLAALMLER